MRSFFDATNTPASDEFSKWQVGSEYKIVKLLGQGSYGSVVEAIHAPT